MTVNVFDALTRTASRRGTLMALGGAGLASFTGAALALGVGRFALEGEAKKKHRKRKNKNKKRKETQEQDAARVDVTCPGPPDQGFRLQGDGARLVQTFTAGRGGQLERVDLILAKEAGSSGDYLLQLTPLDGSGLPTNNILATAVVANAAVPAEIEATVAFRFAAPASVDEGDDFALVLSRPGSNDLRWEGRRPPACTGVGTALEQNDPSQPSTAIADHTFILTTFVRS